MNKEKYHKANLLIVEDEPDLLETTSQLCEEIGCQIHQASDGVTAWKLIENNQIDLILSDINMPGMTGLELLSRVRKFDRNIPFIIMSAYTDQGNKTAAGKLGATLFIEKPFDADHLLMELKKVIQHKFGK